MRNQVYARSQSIINTSISILLFAVSFLYSVFFSNFAELHLNIPAFDFPVFIGEITLFVCVVGLLLKIVLFFLENRQCVCLNRMGLILGMFFYSFIVVKALCGFSKWGPLAFRNAALFYYSFFGIIAFYCIDFKFVQHRAVRLVWLFLLSVALVYKQIVYDFNYSLYIIMLSLFAVATSSFLTHIFFFGATLVYFKMGFLVPGRGVLLSALSAYLFLGGYWLWTSKIKKRWKFFIVGASCLSLLFFILMKIDRPVLESMLRIPNCLKETRELLKDVNARTDYQFPKVEVKLYEDNQSLKISGDDKVQKVILNDITFVPCPAQLTEAQFAQFLSQYVSENDYKLDVSNLNPFLPHPGQGIWRIKMRRQILYSLPTQLIYSDFEKSLFHLCGSKETASLNLVGSSNKQSGRTLGSATGNITWRLLVWHDLLAGLYHDWVLGVDFGQPFRSKSVEVLGWSAGRWIGWLEPHNSFLHILYRGGVVGFFFLVMLVLFFLRGVRNSIVAGDMIAGALWSVIVFWVIMANFQVVLELPYYAIPFWSLFGGLYRFSYDKVRLKQVPDVQVA